MAPARRSGQATVLAAIALPAFLLFTLGVLEVGSVYSQSVLATRAAAAAAAVAADLVGQGISGELVPPFATAAAADAAARVLGGSAQMVSVDVRWGGPAVDVSPYPGEELEATVPLPRFDPGTTTLRWGEGHGFSYQYPDLRIQRVIRQWTPQMGSYTDTWHARTTMYDPAPPHAHNRYDRGLTAGWQTVYGSVLWFGLLWVFPCKFPCVPVAGTALGWSSSPWVYWAAVYDYLSGTGNEQGWLERPGYIVRSAGAAVSAGPVNVEDRWLAQVGWLTERGRFDDNPQEGVVGEYAVYMGDEDSVGRAIRDPDGMLTRLVSATVSVRIRALTMLTGWWADGLVVSRIATAEARL